MSFRCLIYMEKAKTSLNVTDCNLFLSLSLYAKGGSAVFSHQAKHQDRVKVSQAHVTQIGVLHSFLGRGC